MSELLNILRDSGGFSGFHRTKSISREVSDKILYSVNFCPLSHKPDEFHYETVWLSDFINTITRDILKNNIVKDAKTLIVISDKQGTFLQKNNKRDVVVSDITLCASYMMLTAVSYGLICRMFREFNRDHLRKTLGFSSEYEPIIILALGHSKR